MNDKRQEPRVAGVFEAKWHAQSKAATCTLADLSWHGCFVNVVHPPAVNEKVDVTVTLGDTRVELQGSVRHVWPRIGFGMQLDATWPRTEGERVAMRTLLNEGVKPTELDWRG